MPAQEPMSPEPVPTHVEPLVAVLEGPAPCDHCPVAHDCGTHRLACLAFTAYVDGASEASWRSIERQPTREQWGKLFELKALKATTALLRQLAKRSRRPVVTPEQQRERWRLASRMRRARNAQRGPSSRPPAADVAKVDGRSNAAR